MAIVEKDVVWESSIALPLSLRVLPDFANRAGRLNVCKAQYA
jgi:hypothetical protein